MGASVSYMANAVAFAWRLTASSSAIPGKRLSGSDSKIEGA